jgi:hypothetical protein
MAAIHSVAVHELLCQALERALLVRSFPGTVDDGGEVSSAQLPSSFALVGVLDLCPVMSGGMWCRARQGVSIITEEGGGCVSARAHARVYVTCSTCLVIIHLDQLPFEPPA